MATGLDELIDFLLSEIALCGTQGTWGRSSYPSIRILLSPHVLILLLENLLFRTSMKYPEKQRQSIAGRCRIMTRFYAFVYICRMMLTAI
jgi:DNA phosphorothioation-dependent restriction protein DptG